MDSAIHTCEAEINTAFFIRPIDVELFLSRIPNYPGLDQPPKSSGIMYGYIDLIKRVSN